MKKVIGLLLAAGFIWMEVERKSDDTPPKPEPINTEEVDSSIGYKRGYNFKKQDGSHNYHYYDVDNMTDEDIRHMRNVNPHLIIKVPGRQILSRQDQFNRDIERYIEENEDEIRDQLMN